MKEKAFLYVLMYMRHHAVEQEHDIPDHEVVASVLKDKNNFGIIVRRYQAPLMRYMWRIGVRSVQDREDVLQNVFIKTYKNIQGYNAALSFSSWIYRIVHNEVVDFFRARRVRPEGNAVDDSEEALDQVAASGDIIRDLDTAYAVQDILRVLDALNVTYKEVIVLKFFEQKTYTEISDILKVPEGTVATLIHRAKKKLQQHLSHIHTQ